MLPYAGASNYSLAPFNKQWAIKLYTGKIDTIAALTTPIACPVSTVDYNNPCSQPALQQFTGDAVKVTWGPLNASAGIRTLNAANPTQFYVRLCYAAASIVDRGWRKKNKGFPQYDNSCPITVGVSDYSPSGGSAILDLGVLDRDEFVPTATWYAQVCVACSGSYCQCDNTAAKANFETLKYTGRTTAMITACIILSCFCPLFLIAFWTLDVIKYNRTGRALKLFHS
ncbi:MAG: hypothetical protein WDW36_001586 [Sanguina aurantia]